MMTLLSPYHSSMFSNHPMYSVCQHVRFSIRPEFFSAGASYFANRCGLATSSFSKSSSISSCNVFWLSFSASTAATAGLSFECANVQMHQRSAPVSSANLRLRKLVLVLTTDR